MIKEEERFFEGELTIHRSVPHDYVFTVLRWDMNLMNAIYNIWEVNMQAIWNAPFLIYNKILNQSI